MITLPNKPIVVEDSDTQGVFEVTACYPGYAATIGNAIRRVLLSSLPGIAVTGIKVKGVQHEFSTIPYVKEDVVQLILNLKQIRFKLKADFDEGRKFKARLHVTGEKEAKAGDIKGTAEIEIVNKDAHIADLTGKKAELDMELEIGCGLGYSAVEERKEGKLEVGRIAIDAIFSPIRKVNYLVENMRVGDRTDYGRIRFNVETDGTVAPKEAFSKAVKILVDHYKMLSSFEEAAKRKKKASVKKAKGKKKEAKKTTPSYRGAKDIKIDELKISSRLISILQDAGIKSVAGLVRKNEDDLKKIEGLGDKGATDIKRAVGKFGFILKK